MSRLSTESAQLPQDRRHEGWRRIVVGLCTTAVAIAAAIVTTSTAAASTAVAPQAVSPVVDAGRLASFDATMISLVNQKRSAAGLPAVKEASGLTQLAIWWSQQMVNGKTGGELAHNPNAQSMLASYGAAHWTSWGENVAKFGNGASAAAVFDAYWNSPGHKANILGKDFRYIGMGTVQGDKATFNTMEFTATIDAVTPPKTTTSKPQPSTTKPPASTTTAPKTTASKPPAQKTSAQKPAAKSEKEFRPASLPSVKSKPKAPPTPVKGTIAATVGASILADIHFDIRDARCEGSVLTGATGWDKPASVSLVPGNYCAVVTGVPDGLARPQPVTFSADAGGSFVVSWDHLTPEPPAIPLRARGSHLMLPV